MPLLASQLPKYTGPHHVSTIDIEHTLPAPRTTSPTLHHRHPFDPSHPHAFQIDTVLFSIFYPSTPPPTASKSPPSGSRSLIPGSRSLIPGSHSSRRPKHLWVPKPVSLTAQGYARLAHCSNWLTDRVFTAALWTLARSVRVYADVDLPLADAPSATSTRGNGGETESNSKPHRWPIIVFSHGMASGRTSYTHLMGELASRGYVVVAIEHRDGSGTGSLVCEKGAGLGERKARPVLHITQKDVVRVTPALEEESRFVAGDARSTSSSEKGQAQRRLRTTAKDDVEHAEFKVAQLHMREAEIEEVVNVLRLIERGGGDKVYAGNARGEGRDLSNWAGRLDLDKMVLGGHSFGANTVLQALMHPPTSALPFKGGFAFDPGKSSGPLNNTIASPLLIINSASWSSTPSVFYGRPHFDVVHEIARHCGLEKPSAALPTDSTPSTSSSTTATPSSSAKTGEVHHKPSHSNSPAAWFLTLNHSAHPNCTDAPLIEPLLLRLATGAKIDAAQGVRAYVDASEAFVRYAIGQSGWHEGVLGEREMQEQDEEVGGVGGVGTGHDDASERPNNNPATIAAAGNDVWRVHVAPDWKRCGRGAPG